MNAGPPRRERRPLGKEPAPTQSFRGDEASLQDRPFDLLTATRPELDVFFAGYGSGYSAGWDAGYAACNNEIAALQRHAAAIVHAHSRIPERDREADRARRERIDARFTRRAT